MVRAKISLNGWQIIYKYCTGRRWVTCYTGSKYSLFKIMKHMHHWIRLHFILAFPRKLEPPRYVNRSPRVWSPRRQLVYKIKYACTTIPWIAIALVLIITSYLVSSPMRTIHFLFQLLVWLLLLPAIPSYLIGTITGAITVFPCIATVTCYW